MDVTELRECPACGSKNVVHSYLREQVICRECGNIFEPLIPLMQEKFDRVASMEFGDDVPSKTRISRGKKAIPYKKVAVVKKSSKIHSSKKTSSKKKASKRSGKKKR